MNTSTYLSRINYHGPLSPTLDILRALHRQHMYTVPFENLNIHQHWPILLDEASLFQKIVQQRRGGYCFELNGLFANLLRQLGFKVDLLSAGVWDGKLYGPLSDHLCLLVHLEEPWLADVGFGDSAIEPLRFNDRDEQPSGPNRTYRIQTEQDSLYSMWECQDEGEWRPGYLFGLQPMRMHDFSYANYYMQTSPESPFTRKRVCSRATPAGRVTLSELRLITSINGQREERDLADEQEWQAILREQFDIVLDAPLTDKVPA